jgi:hypothetical protein
MIAQDPCIAVNDRPMFSRGESEQRMVRKEHFVACKGKSKDKEGQTAAMDVNGV